MSSVIDLPIRESPQQRREFLTADLNVHWPRFGYWVKAGIAFTIGAMIVTLASYLLWMLFIVNIIIGFGRMVAR
jgi:hypothetical protein